MIVLDEQLQGLGLEEALSRWYRGAIFVIKQLRPGTVIKDEAIPSLLRRLKQPTFVTINAVDFWRRVPADHAYSIVCMERTAAQAHTIPGWLRQVFRFPEFRTKKARMGKVVFVRSKRLQYYSIHEQQIHFLIWPPAG